MLPMYVRFRKGRQDLTGVKIWFDFQGYYQTRFVFTVNLLKKQKQGEDTTQTSLGNGLSQWTTHLLITLGLS